MAELWKKPTLEITLGKVIEDTGGVEERTLKFHSVTFKKNRSSFTLQVGQVLRLGHKKKYASHKI